MILLKEELFCNEQSLDNGFIKEFYPNSTLISKYQIGYYKHKYEYDEHSRLKLELITEEVGHEDEYEILYKKDYQYFENGCRILFYRIGFTKFREVNRVEWVYDERVDLPDIIHQENELLSIEEIRISEKELITSSKITNFKSNSISVYEYFYDDFGRLINKKGGVENQSIEFSYSGENLDFSINANIKIMHYYDNFKKEIRREYINTNEYELTPLLINFNYLENNLREIIIDLPGFGCLYDFETTKSVIDYASPTLSFDGFVESEEKHNDSFEVIQADYRILVNILKLPSFHYLGWIEEFWRIGFKKIHAKYNYNNDIESITFMDELDSVIDKLNFSYFDNFNTDSQSKLKNIQCFKIRNTEIVKLFEHSFYY